MNKVTHRIISALMAIVLLFFIVGFGLYFGLHIFVMFLLTIPFLLVPLFRFIKKPMKCDQNDCGGVAKLEIGPQHSGKWYGFTFQEDINVQDVAIL